MIRKGLNCSAEFHIHTPNILELELQLESTANMSLICVHMASDNHAEGMLQYGELTTVVRARLISQQHTIVGGDFNAHLGSDDVAMMTDGESQALVGQILHHTSNNGNGDLLLDMIELLDLRVLTTMMHSSTRVTWSVANLRSQIDHVLIPSAKTLSVHRLRAQWTKLSDHKLILFFVTVEKSVTDSDNNIRQEGLMKPLKRSRWDLALLNGPTKKEQYDDEIISLLKEIDFSTVTIDQHWRLLCDVSAQAANKLLQAPRLICDPRVTAAYVELRKSISIANRQRLIDMNYDYDAFSDYPPDMLPGLLENVKVARKRYETMRRESNVRQFTSLLNHLDETVAREGERVQEAFKFVKASRRSTSSSVTKITVRDWEIDLQSVAGDSVPLIIETDMHPILKPPSYGDMCDVLARMKNGKAPVLDMMCIEMIKSSQTLAKSVHGVIEKCFQNNELPSSWQTTVSQPIPKVLKPKAVNDYRKITLCSVGYKLYANLLQEKLDDYIPDIHDYQAGFVRNRSCDDQLFIIKRILEERWNHALPTYILGLDLSKAFDKVDIHKLPQILNEHHVPHHLINRYIKTCLHEQSCVTWLGNRTQVVNKTIGIKQGCPVSPRVFNLILDHAIQELKLELAHLESPIELFLGEPEDELKLPMLLAYADDVTALTSSLSTIKIIVETFIPILQR